MSPFKKGQLDDFYKLFNKTRELLLLFDELWDDTTNAEEISELLEI